MDDDVNTILGWMGFDTAAKRATVADEAGLLNLTSFRDLDRQGVGELASCLRKRTPNNTRLHLSKGKQDMLVKTAHWVSDFLRVSLEPEIPTNDDDEQDQELFEAALMLAQSRAEARKYLRDNTKTLSEAAEPNKLKDEKDWYTFVDQFYTYLSAIPGVNGIPLAYIVREKDDPDHETEWEDDQFNEQMIACAPLQRAAFITDAQSVHLLIWTFIESEELTSIIKPLKRRKNGRMDYSSLRNYMMGPGNVSRRVGNAKLVRANLHYKNERAMKFTVFLTKLRHVYQVYEEEGRPVPEEEKVEELLEKIKAPFLSAQVANLVGLNTFGDLSFERATNVLATVVASSPEAKGTRIISQTRTQEGGPLKLRRLKGGAVDVEYEYPPQEYSKLNQADKRALKQARDQAGWTRKGPKKPGQKPPTQGPSVKVSEISQIIQDAVSDSVGKLQGQSQENQGGPEPGHAGTAFGGRNSKKQGGGKA